MNQPDTEKLAYAIVGDALQSYPLDKAPPTLLPAVMARIQVAPVVPRFRLTWFDYAISLFGAAMAGLVFVLWRFSELLFVDLQLKLLYWWQQPQLLLIWVTLLGAMILVGVSVVVAADIFSNTRTSHLN